MRDQFDRAKIILGDDAIDILMEKRVAVFGLGGVGSFACEAVARCGVGTLDIVDADVVSLTNINRQLIAAQSTIGRPKVDVMAERIADIFPECRVNKKNCFFLPETADEFDFSEYDYVIDAIDTVTGKISLIMECEKTHTPIISSMGAGNKLDPSAFEVADIYDTSVCPLAKVMRRELKKRGIKRLKVVYSKEEAIKPRADIDEMPPKGRRAVPGSVSFVPPVAGYIMGGEVIKDLLAIHI